MDEQIMDDSIMFIIIPARLPLFPVFDKLDQNIKPKTNPKKTDSKFYQDSRKHHAVNDHSESCLHLTSHLKKQSHRTHISCATITDF
uniref:Uncharacterized protein n=1 Tax=Anguilla anguilla TaxID=7936 RepID=A0A0E9X1M6_ANGAN